MPYACFLITLSYIIIVKVYAFLCVHLVYAQAGLQDMKTLSLTS